jgi:hypothetical protein
MKQSLKYIAALFLQQYCWALAKVFNRSEPGRNKAHYSTGSLFINDWYGLSLPVGYGLLS